ncbi:hypothetical protein ACJJTC_010135, partial [Scirpophaga incertulas]
MRNIYNWGLVAQVQALRADNTSLRERVAALEGQCTALTAALAGEADRRNKENKVLARKVAELTEELADSNKKLEWEKGETGVLKKKHASTIKELNRELQRALKRCEQLESKLPQPDAGSTRTGSVTSLSSSESAPQEDRLPNGHSDAVPEIQALIERIVALQRAAARRAERCEFLEEHSRQLTGELRAKAKLLRHLLCSLPAGAVGSQDRDLNKARPNLHSLVYRQALIERIVSLQRAAARRAERCEFLEEHSRQLTGELRAKAKLLRHLLCSLPAGA